MDTKLRQAVIALAKELDEKFAEDVSVLQITEISPLADYFVIATAGSEPQLSSLSLAAGKCLKDHDISLKHTEASRGSKWVLLDFGVIILHLFLADEREFYNLDGIWRDAPKLEI